jgi:elongation factor P
MSVKSTDLRKGQVIEKDGDLLVITEYEHRTPGNLRAIINIRVKSLSTGQNSQMRLSSSDALEVAYLDRRKCEYLYKDAFTEQHLKSHVSLRASLL